MSIGTKVLGFGVGAAAAVVGLLAFRKGAAGEDVVPPPPPEAGLANLWGQVTEAGNLAALIRGAAVDLDSLQVVTDNQGVYRFVDQALGPHTVRFSAAGYEPYSQVVDLAEGNNQLDVQLTVIPFEPPPDNGGQAPFTFGKPSLAWEVWAPAPSLREPVVTIMVSNPSAQNVTHTLTAWRVTIIGGSYPDQEYATSIQQVVTLAPGESRNLTFRVSEALATYNAVQWYYFFLEDEMGNRSPNTRGY